MKKTMNPLFLCALGLLAIITLGLTAVTPQEDAKTFVGEKKCKKCHIKEHKTWSDTKHAVAFDCLDEASQKDEKCVKCHTTGYGEGGFVSLEETPDFVGVQCEMCHGAGGAHIELTTQLKKDKVDKENYPEDKHINRHPTSCTRCHNPHVKHDSMEK